MKKTIKNNYKLFIGLFIGVIVSCISVYAINASEITYGNTTVDQALDDLYTKPTVKKICRYVSNSYVPQGNRNEDYPIGTEYECEVATGVTKTFFILVENTNTVKLIMDRNITQGTSTTTMSWTNAMKYIDNNNLKSSWNNVFDVDLPLAQDIANAVGNSSWKAAENDTWWCFASKTKDYPSSEPYCNTEAASAYNWLYDYASACNGCTHSLNESEAAGYWTRDAIVSITSAWNVGKYGNLSTTAASTSTYYGVRPVITVLKSNLYTE